MHGLRDIAADPAQAGMSGPAKVQTERCSLPVMLALFAVSSITVVAYLPVIFDFFAGDDFVHLSWLSQAVNHPELLLRNFHSSWLDGTTTKFYRPLISLFMYTDYLVGKTNGVFFHITNLLFHLASTIFLFFIVRQIGQSFRAGGTAPAQRGDRVKDDLRALLCAALFGLYPLHPEAVSWITGRVDSIVTAFCLASICFYMQWRLGGGKLLFFLSFASCAAGLLSKEMAVTLPAVFLCRELLILRQAATDGDRVSPLARRGTVMPLLAGLAAAIRPTLPFWALLAVYFAVRYFALGTFVGGYDNSLFFVANPGDFFLSWLHALRMFVEPINRTLLGSRELLTRVWQISLLLVSFCLIKAFRTCRPQLLFTLAWLALSLLPVYKIFAIADDLQGSRLAYLATAPLAVLFSFACFSWQRGPVSLTLSAVLAATLLGASFSLLQVNNSPWVAAGRETNAIRAELRRLYGSEISADPHVLFIGLPDQINGAYTCRNALDGMTKYPQLQRSITNGIMINPFEPIFPFGYLKDSIAAERNNILVYRWDSASRKFVSVQIAPPSASAWSCAIVEQTCRAVEGAAIERHVNPDGSIDLSTGSKAGFIDVFTGERGCWSTDFIQARIRLKRHGGQARSGLELLYCNALNPGFELKRRAHADFDQQRQEQTLTFALRGLPDWSFGGDFHKVRILIPAGTALSLLSISSPPAESLLPSLSFDNSGYLGSKGYLHLSPSEAVRTLRYDCSKIAGAKSAQLEVSRANLLFEEQNCRKESCVQWKKIPLANTRGSINLNYYRDGAASGTRACAWPSPGIYEIRLRAQDESGNLAGLASDHIVVSIDPG